MFMQSQEKSTHSDNEKFFFTTFLINIDGVIYIYIYIYIAAGKDSELLIGLEGN